MNGRHTNPQIPQSPQTSHTPQTPPESPAARSPLMTSRRGLLGAAGGAAVAGALGPLSGVAAADSARHPQGGRNEDYGFGKGGDLPLDRIGIQLFTVRDLLADNELDLSRTFEMLADAGYAEFEIGGDYDGRTPAQLRKLADAHGLKVAGNHFGPRGMVENIWYDPKERARIYEEAHALGLKAVGTGHSYTAPRTVDGYKRMAAAFNVWGREAVRNGFDYFYFHNHDVEFTLVDGVPLYDILLEETDPRYVKFELDLGWIEISGQSAYEYISRDPERFPLFHVKDIRWDPNGNREAQPGTANAGKRFFFTDPGKGDVDYPRIFSALKNPAHHHFLVEHDDAGNDETADENSPRPLNPAGSANTAWTGRKYLANLEISRRKRH
ncbi:sugar phosphate isomerase/epimerase family protein [Streptomyces sp. NPDC059255]|uniref:sugar phosphate isomerase/epimerase family protein n=1 Tax=Streptomyces sp. NPDC059255 TaxID=3346793 RepID=UPI0036880BDB